MNQLLSGSNQEENIVAVYPSSDRSMRVYTRKTNGITSQEVEFYPFFFLSSSKFLKDFPKKHWIKELNGNNYYRYLCAFSSWLEMWDAIRYVMMRYNENASTKADSYSELPIIHVRTDPVAQFLKQSGRTLFKGMKFDDLHRMQINIKTHTKHGFNLSNPHRAEDRIGIIALSDNRGWEFVINGKGLSEKEMLIELIQIIKQKDYDVIEGHNIYNFTLPYLLTRCEMFEIDFAIGRDDSVPHPFDKRLSYTERSLDYSSFEISGRHIIDTFQILQTYDASKRSLENYSLNHAAQHFGFAKKDRAYIQPDRINRYLDDEPETLIQCCLDDNHEICQLSEFLSPNIFYMTQMLPFNFGTVARLGASAKIESLLLREYIRQKHSIPKPDISSQTLGGYTDIFYTGILGPIVDADVESLYPSIMLSEKISPYTETLGIFQPLLDELTKMRINAKRKMETVPDPHEKRKHDAIQSAFKTLINSFYGYLGYNRALFNDSKAADQIVRNGHKILKQIITTITDLGGEVIEVDTDRVFFTPPQNINNEPEEKKFLKKIKKHLQPAITLLINGRYQKMLSYKKKNYALLGYDSKVKIKGASLISRNMERFGREFIQGCIEGLLQDDIGKVHEQYAKYNKLIFNRQLMLSDFARTEYLRESSDEYNKAVETGTRNRAASYEVAIKSNIPWKPGDKVSYYFTGDDPNIKGFENCKLADEWDSNFPDENIQYYLKRLDEFAKKFEEFFSENDFHAIFSVDDLFVFSPKGIKILTTRIKSEIKEVIEEKYESIHVEPKILLDDESE